MVVAVDPNLFTHNRTASDRCASPFPETPDSRFQFQSARGMGYPAFGTSYSPRTTAEIDQRYTYTGREKTTDPNLMYYRWRMYGSGIGRFVSRDPLGALEFVNPSIRLFVSHALRSDHLLNTGYADSLNLYCYAMNSTSIYSDSYGLIYCCHEWTPAWDLLGYNSLTDCWFDLVGEMFPFADSVVGATATGALSLGASLAGAGAAASGGAAFIGGGIVALIGGAEAVDTCSEEHCTKATPPDTCCSPARAFFGLDPEYECCLTGDEVDSMTATRQAP